MNACWFSRSVFYQVFNREVTFLLKKILERLCYYKWKAWYKLLSSSGLKKCCTHFYHAPNILLRSTKYRARIRLCSKLKKGTNWKFIFPERKIKGSFQVHNLVRDFWKSITSCTFLHHIVVHACLLPCKCTHAPKISVRHTKHFVSEFPIHSALKLPLRGLVVFIDMSNRKQEFQNIFEIKLCNYFRQLLLTS